MQQKNVLEYLEKTVVRVPEKVAYSSFEGEEVSLTFKEVYDNSRAIGTYLNNNGFYKEPVVILMKKTPKAIAAFYGCVYGGCLYVPMDEEMPKARMGLILDSLKPGMLICDKDTEAEANELGFEGKIAKYEDIIKTDIDDSKLSNIRDKQIDTDPIYIVYTSGSTGIPKGIAACHRSVIDYIEQLSAVLEFDEDTRFGNQSPFYFDACLKELYPTLKFGASAVIVPKQLFMFPLKLVEFLNEKGVNTVCWVVSALTMISALGALKKEVPHLRTVAFGSEVFPIKQFKRWREALPDAKFINLYGPTEATGMSCYYKVNRDFEEGDAIPIGRAFDNTEIILLDDDNKIPANGEPGEICIRGTALTLGYYNDPERTAVAFVQNPLNTHYPELIYRTGDLAKYNEYGELVFISRKDYQIKHMGHRIELGEIEANINAIEGIYLSCATYNKVKDRIVLYYTGELDDKELGNLLTDKLPRYMLPSVIKKLEEMPLTPNGKINRKQLAEQS